MNLSLFSTIITLVSISLIVIYKIYLTISYIIDGFHVLIIAIITIPLLIAFLLFPVYFVISNVLLLFTTSNYWKRDSKYFKYRLLNDHTYTRLPPITIQVPIYDEDFKKVIRPTLRDCVKARNFYIEKGGRCNIIVNDDGIFKFLNDRLNSLESNKEVVNRIKYYKRYNISFTARKMKGREGKFKKASNMNYGQKLTSKYRSPLSNTRILMKTPPFVAAYNQFRFSTRTIQSIGSIAIDLPFEEKTLNIDYIMNKPNNINLTCLDEKMPIIIEENISTPKQKPLLYKDIIIDRERRHMYYGDIEIKKYILLIDSDTTIPHTILPDTIKLFEDNPTLGYTQHYTLPLKSSYQNYFSSMISLFTQNLYHVIFRVCTRNGDISPLIGHNITIRKEALEKISLHNKNNMFWRDDRVSEDFDLCLRMYQTGYKGIYVCSEDKTFGEGVSLSYMDEIIKYSKFSYGASEILFCPIKQWCQRGIFTQSFKQFIKSPNVPFSSKIGIFGYLMTYFSISSSIILTPTIAICSCFVVKWEFLLFDPFYAYLSLFAIYGILNPIVMYKLKKQFHNIKDFPPNIYKEFFSGIFFSVFYCSISFPMFLGIIAHLLDLKIGWGSTVKSLINNKRSTIILNLVKAETIQFVYSFVICLLSFFLYMFVNMPPIMLFPMLSLGLGHIFTPFILTPTIFCKNQFKFNELDTPVRELKV